MWLAGDGYMAGGVIMAEVGVLEARNNLSGLIKQALAGEEVIITSRNVPQVRLVPVEPKPVPGTLAAIMGRPRLKQPIHTAEEVEAIIQDNRNAWDEQRPWL
jgi:prevent-host-death family protein